MSDFVRRGLRDMAIIVISFAILGGLMWIVVRPFSWLDALVWLLVLVTMRWIVLIVRERFGATRS